jgi:uncharacterized membrane protein (Fun14 family)
VTADDGNFPRRHCTFALMVCAISYTVMPPPATAADDIEKYVITVMAAAGPILASLGFSGIIGLCVGKALKAVSGCIAIAVGITFIAVQLISHQTGKEINFKMWEQKATKIFDHDRDG